MDKRQKILIVDDSEFNRDMLKEILRETYNYLEAENGNQAIQIMGENPGIDLMLLDINMPQMNGFEVLKWMNQSRCIDETPVIMISSEEKRDIIERAYILGAEDYIRRPFDAFIVRRRVQNILNLYANQKRLKQMVSDQIYEKEENNNLMIGILSHVVEFRNSESGEHIIHIRMITELLLRCLVQKTDQYHLSESEIAIITTASALHDIGKISKIGTVNVEKYMCIERFSHVMHIGSTVTGQIRDDKDAVDGVDAILPAGTLSGAPKFRACQIIQELEQSKRGIYGGAIGYLDFAGNLDTCIAIRLVYKKNGEICIRSGAGIVADSIPESEFQECCNKARAVVQAIETAQEGLE